MCEALGVARSNVHALKCRPFAWIDGRTGRTPRGDSELLAEIREQIAELPSYGYRRACALVNRQRGPKAPRVNPKRAYRVMAGNGLLLFFRVDDFDPALERVRALVRRLEEEPHVNENTRTREFSLRDPDGYYVTVSELPAP